MSARSGASAFVGPPVTRNYRPSVVSTPGTSLLYSGSFGLRTYSELEEMALDPRVDFALRVLYAPLNTFQVVTADELSQKPELAAAGPKIVVEGEPEVQQFVARTVRRFWQTDLVKAHKHLKYGNLPGEFVYRFDEQADLVEYEHLRDVHPADGVPLQLGGELAGVRVNHLDLRPPRSFWLANEPEFGSLFGKTRLRGVWAPWKEKRGRHGAVDSRRLWYCKNAFRGGTIRHPPGFTEDENGVVKSNEDYAREILEKYENGGILVLPNVRDEQRNYLWEFEPPAPNGELRGILDYADKLDHEMFEGAGIPVEVVEAADSGSGWAGRTVPFLVFLTSEDLVAAAVLQAFDQQCVRHVVRHNYGPGAKYALRRESLVPRPQAPAGPAGGGGGPPDLGGGLGGGSGPRDLVPYQGPRGGSGYKDPATGRVVYGQQLSLSLSVPEALALAQGDPWQPYQGPQGGRGWRNVITGDVKYGGEKPGDAGGRPGQTPKERRRAEAVRRVRVPVEEAARRAGHRLLSYAQAATEAAARAGERWWDAQPPGRREKLAWLYRKAKAAEHVLLYTFRTSNRLAVEAAKEWGLDDPAARRVGATLAAADWILSFTAGAPAGAAVGGALAGPAGAVAGAKVAMYSPVASLAFVALSAAANPFKTVAAARRVLGAAPAALALSLDPADLRRLAGEVADRLRRTGGSEWYQALLAVALDQAGGDVRQALEAADAAYAGQQAEPGEGGGGEPPPALGLSQDGPDPWQPYVGKRGGKGWRNAVTGRVVYGDRKPGTRKPAAGEKAKPGPRHEKADPAKVAEKVRGLLADKSRLTPDSIREVAEDLLSLTVKDITALKKEFGVKASGLKSELARKVAERVLATAKDPEPRPAAPEKREAADPGRKEETPRGGTRKPDAPGGGPAGGQPEKARGQVEGPAGGPGGQPGGAGGPAGGQPAGQGPRRRVPAAAEEVTRRLDRYEKLFRAKADQHTREFGHAGHWADVGGWVGKLREHVAAVGPEAALAALGEEGGEGDGGRTQYEGKADDMSWFCEAYLDRHGIVPVPAGGPADPGVRVVSSQSPTFGKQVRPDPYLAGDFTPVDPTFRDKLDEAKHLPGLESSEDIGVIVGKPVTHLTDDVVAKMDERYGKGQWIVKTYGDDAFAGFGIYFPQRVEQIKHDARGDIWASGQGLARYGFSHLRDESGKVVGIRHQGGGEYRFGTEAYDKAIQGDARHWADRAAAAAENENGPALFDREGKVSGKDFMAQPAFKAVGISDAERARGVTGAEGGKGEGRTHIVTRNGKAELVPHSTWIKGESLPVVFENDDTRAMARAALDAINALPESERQGQIYAPDVMPTGDGYKVVEANPANETGSSGYLGDNPFIIDAYVSHLTGREPAHVRFLRRILGSRKGAGR